MTDFLDWSLLSHNSCPKCGEMLEFNRLTEMSSCSDTDCDFTISKEKLKRLTSPDELFMPFCEECGNKTNGRFRLCYDCNKKGY